MEQKKKKTKVRVTPDHWQVFIEYAEKYPEIVTNKFTSHLQGKINNKQLWENLTIKIKSLGQGIRTTEEWKKTLTDWKAKTKLKASKIHKHSQGTGGGPHTTLVLTTVEEKLLGLMGTTATYGDATVNEKEKNPYDSCAWNMLGILKERMGLREGSLAAFKNAYRLSSKNQRDKARVNYGRLLSKSGRYQEAIEMFQDVEAATFNSGSGLALALFENQQYEESYSAYESALHWLTEEQSSQSDLLVALASMAYKFQGPGEAKTLLFQSIALRSPSPWSLYATLSLALVHNDLKLAKLVLNEMDEFKDKKDCLYHYSVLLSYVYISKGEYVAAIREISKLVHRHPDHVGVWLTLALLFIRLEDHIKWSPAAAKCALLVMKLGQTNMDVTKCIMNQFNQIRAEIVTMLKESSTGDQVKDQIYAGEPKYMVLCLVSLASHISGDDKQALKAAQKAIHCYPNVAEGWAVLAFALKNNVKKIQLTPKFLKLIFKHIESLNPSEILLHWVHNRINKIK